MTVYGYWRCSTDHQDQQRQVLALKEAGCDVITGDKVTGVSDLKTRAELSKLLEEMESGSTLILSELSRLSRSFIGMVNEVVPHDELMQRSRELAARIALVPEPAVRMNKAIAMQGLQASGVYASLLLEGSLGALAHSSHNEHRENLYKTMQEDGVRAYLQKRDGPFQPEPMGPRSAAAISKKNKK